MSGHVSPIIASAWLLHARREIEVATQAANERFDRATASEAGWEAFWASCERGNRGVEFRVEVNGEAFVFRDGWLLGLSP